MNTQNNIDNYLTKVIHENNCFIILTFIDFDILLTEELFKEYIVEVITDNPILKKYINENAWVLDDTFILQNHYEFVCSPYDNFNTYTRTLLNEPFSTVCKWKATILVDNKLYKTRMYVRIEHSYCDGYKLIDMLTNKLFPKRIKPSFKRTSEGILQKLYYIIIGTLILLWENIKVVCFLMFCKSPSQSKTINTPDSNKTTTTNIFCGSIELDKIKKITYRYGVTVNTVLYGLMVKTWYNYNGLSAKPGFTVSPINLNQTYLSNNTNNMFFLFTQVENNNNTGLLLKTIDALFNLYKMSLYVPIINELTSLIFPFIPSNVAKAMFHDLFNRVDLTYSNIIGPKIPPDCNIIKLKNIQFTTTTNSHEIFFNIISFENNVNINISCRDGVIKCPNEFLQAFNKACIDMGIEHSNIIDC